MIYIVCEYFVDMTNLIKAFARKDAAETFKHTLDTALYLQSYEGRKKSVEWYKDNIRYDRDGSAARQIEQELLNWPTFENWTRSNYGIEDVEFEA